MKATIRKRKGEIISKVRAGVTETEIPEWFNQIIEFPKNILEDSDRFFNSNETGVDMCPKTGKVLGPKITITFRK